MLKKRKLIFAVFTDNLIVIEYFSESLIYRGILKWHCHSLIYSQPKYLYDLNDD